jgi:hypothetical protein
LQTVEVIFQPEGELACADHAKDQKKKKKKKKSRKMENKSGSLMAMLSCWVNQSKITLPPNI